jgi:hypothetical protein
MRGDERGAVGMTRDAMAVPLQVGTNLIEHLVVGVPAHHDDIERRRGLWHRGL